MLTQYYILVKKVLTLSADVLRKIRELATGELGDKRPGKNPGQACEKRLQNVEKKKIEVLRYIF